MYAVHMDSKADVASNVMGFEDMRRYLCSHGVHLGVSTLSMRLTREFKASPDKRLRGQLPRPFMRVSNRTFPLWWKPDVDAVIPELGGNKSNG